MNSIWERGAFISRQPARTGAGEMTAESESMQRRCLECLWWRTCLGCIQQYQPVHNEITHK